ncbi:hypothetical protein JZU46_04915 [bacterium]|jgi:hypothetical protein|nr:hypothetical protein [bacterium]
MNNKPQFKIHGKDRRIKKHELAELKSYVKNFWHCEDVSRVMGSGMSDEECTESIEMAKTIIKLKEQELNEHYTD